MKKLKLFLMMFCAAIAAGSFSGCDDDEDGSRADKNLDGTLFGEWIENDGNRYVHGYMCFYDDGTGISGSYESDIDLVNEDEDFEWYTAGDDEHLYINGTRHKYWCNGTSLTNYFSSGKTRSYREK